MKNGILSGVVSVSLVVGSMAYGGVPQMSVTVADSSGKMAYKGGTSAKGSFATPKLQPSQYTVQFSSNSAPKGSRYTLVIAAGSKKVAANAIAAEKLAGGGVAMKIDVGAGSNITGQVAAEDKTAAPLGTNGKPMVWIPKKIGSNIAAHWAESDSAEAKEVQTSSSYSAKNIQDKQAQGISPNQGGEGGFRRP
jgi:hypothetical protein